MCNLVKRSRGEVGSCYAKWAVMMRAVIVVIVRSSHHSGKQKEQQDNNRYRFLVSHAKGDSIRHGLYYYSSHLL